MIKREMACMRGKIDMIQSSRYRQAQVLSKKQALTFELAKKAKKNWFTSKAFRKKGVGTHHTANKLVEMGLLEVKKVKVRGFVFEKKYRWTGKNPEIPCWFCRHSHVMADRLGRKYHFCVIHEARVNRTATCDKAEDPMAAGGGANQWL